MHVVCQIVKLKIQPNVCVRARNKPFYRHQIRNYRLCFKTEAKAVENNMSMQLQISGGKLHQKSVDNVTITFNYMFKDHQLWNRTFHPTQYLMQLKNVTNCSGTPANYKQIAFEFTDKHFVYPQKSKLFNVHQKIPI